MKNKDSNRFLLYTPIMTVTNTGKIPTTDAIMTTARNVAKPGPRHKNKKNKDKDKETTTTTTESGNQGKYFFTLLGLFGVGFIAIIFI